MAVRTAVTIRKRAIRNKVMCLDGKSPALDQPPGSGRFVDPNRNKK
ncbi:hypothetical protein SynBMKMC1_02712 [Synechococcus sp. BMK-MC-1]|nr:hypothetical protein SynBMKMC1_02712 [Synechococcus sp. BMK-MC-1]